MAGVLVGNSVRLTGANASTTDVLPQGVCVRRIHVTTGTGTSEGIGRTRLLFNGATTTEGMLISLAAQEAFSIGFPGPKGMFFDSITLTAGPPTGFTVVVLLA